MRLIHKSKNLQNRSAYLTHNLINDRTFKPGAVVLVRSKDEIQASIDGWNQLKGCFFMEEMYKYCRIMKKAFKRVNKFLDE